MTIVGTPVSGSGWTYGGSPSTSTRDEFRLLVGDTDTTDQIFTDGEVAYWLAQNSNVTLAAALGCRAAAAKYARQVSFSVGKLSEQAAQKAERFLSLAKELEAQYRRTSASAFSSAGTPSVAMVYDSGTQPKDYEVSGEAHPDWSLNSDDQPSEVRGIES